MAEEASKDTNFKSTVEAVVGLVKAVPIYDDAVQPVAKQVGKSLEVVGKTVNMALAPLRLVVWGYEQLESWLTSRVTEKLKDVPQSNIITPSAQIAGPAIEALRYVADNEDLRELYANLLATAMNKETVHKAHPAYVEILKNITSDEAIFLREFGLNGGYPSMDVQAVNDAAGIAFSMQDFHHINKEITLQQPELLNTYLVNLSRLGLIDKDGPASLSSNYDALKADVRKFVQTKQLDVHYAPINYTKKFITLTPFGRMFVSNVINPI